MASNEKCVYTACPGWGDHEYCAIKTVVKDGKIDHTEKVQYTGVEADEGYICQKGLMSWRQVYNEERLLHPLKRAGERGEGKWEEISWDQALDEISAKLMEIREKYGNESVCVWTFPAGNPSSQGLLEDLLERFTAVTGSTNHANAIGLDNGAEYSLETDLGMGAPYFNTDPAWMNDSDLILVWGANPIENQQRVTNAIVEARSKGAKVYDVGLVFDATAGFADKFYPVRPGSDAALALAMAKVIVDDGAYDRPFLINKTVAPFLVDVSTGKYLHDETDYFYYAWDEQKGEAVRVEPHSYDLHVDATALEGTYEVDGATCKTAFQMLVEHLQDYTPEFQETVTGLPAADCVELARELEKADAIFYDIAYGMRYRNQGEIHRAVTLLSMLTGSVGKPGAGCGYSMATSSWPIPYNIFSVRAPFGLDENGLIIGPNYQRMGDIFKGAKEGKYKAFLKMQGNPVHNTPNRVSWENDVFPNMELIVDYDIWMTDTGELADYVLPDCMPFEREDYIHWGAYGHVMLQEPAIEPVGDNKPPTYYISELARRMGFGEYFDKDEEGWISHILENSPELVNADGSHITMEQLKREKMIRPASLPNTRFNGSVASDEFTTPSGRMEFYADYYADMGEAIAKYRPSIEFPIAPDAKHQYQLFTGRQRFFMQSMFTEDPIMRKLSGGKPFARMNPLDAKREGLRAGDLIEVFNDRGHVKLTLQLEESCPPGTVHVWFGWRKRAYEEGTYAEMTVQCGGDDASDELAMAWFDRNVSAVGGLGSMGTMLAGTWDTLWDVTCAVRKVEE